MNITFRQIDAFRAVISTGRVTQAAATLGVSQPAVSRLISDLEAELGYTLFQRVGRILQPTAEARLLADEIQQAVSGMEHIKDTARAIGSFGHARLRLVTTPTFSTMTLPPLVARFAGQCPEAMISVEVTAADDAVEWMVSQNFDFGITAAEPANPSLDRLTIGNDSAYCILPTDHPLATRKTISAPDLAHGDFISYLPRSQFRMQVDRVFEDADVPRRMRYEARTTDAICRLVSQNLGVSVVGSSRAYLDAIAGCVALPFTPRIAFCPVLIWSSTRSLSAVAEVFLDGARRDLMR